ncbi:DUF4331 domain-containing protein [Angustibacter speluncae]
MMVNRGTRRGLAATGGLALAAAAVAALAPSSSTASSHREAPLVAGDPLVDNTDTYAFVSPDAPDTVTLIANWIPFQEPSGGPNFFPWAEGDEARYNIKVDTDGDAVPDLTYRWEFTSIDTRGDVDYPLPGQPQGDPDADGSFIYNNGQVTSFDDATLLFKQTYTLTVIDAAGTETELIADAPVAPSHVGDASMPDYQALRDEAVVDVGDGITSFVGQAEDPFFLDLRVFDLLYGGDLSESGNDTLARYNVSSIALQVPIESLGLADGDPVIGVWSTTDRASITTRAADGTSAASGPFVQVSRLGNPLVNEVVIPANLKDAFNALAPEDDASVDAAVNKVLNPEVPYLLNAIYGLDIPQTPRNDLATIFLTGLNGLNQPADVTPSEQLRLNTSIAPTAEPNRLGVLAGDNQGFPNGRRLTDDVVDIALQAVAGAVSVDADGAPTGVSIVEPLAAGDGVDENQVAFGDSFPYLALPNSGSSVGAVAPGATTTVTETVTATAGGGGAGGGGGGGGAIMPTGGIDTGDARPASGRSALVASGAIVLVAVGGVATYALRRKRSLGQHL